jgi:hypothetical protein
MENPAHWDLLTSSLAVCDLQKPEKVWAFLALQGLVSNLPGDREFFYGVIQREKAYGEMTGPSLQSRIAGRLQELDIVLAAGAEPDPHAHIAKKRLESLNHLMADKEPFQAVRKSVFCTHCGVEVDNRPAVCPACGKALHDFSETCIKPCERCKTMNPMSARFCQSCGNPFAGLKDSSSLTDAHSIVMPSSTNHSPSRNQGKPFQILCGYCGGMNNPYYKFCRICGASHEPTKWAHVQNTPYATGQQNIPDNAQLPGYWETRMFRLAAAAQKEKAVGDLLSALISAIQDVVVIKQLLAEKGLWDEELYKKLRTERMIDDHSGAGATPWKSYSHFPYTLDEEEFLKHMFNASEEEIEQFTKKAETASELT